MGHRVVAGIELRTRFEDSPLVEVRSQSDLLPELIITFQIESAPGDQVATFARVLFRDVLHYCWIDGEYGYAVHNPDDHAFGLIEIIDSSWLEELASHTMWRDAPKGERLGGVLKESTVRHYRIGFPRYGRFDILCLDLDIERFRGLRSEVMH